MEDHWGKIISGAVTTIVAGFLWLVRTVSTNKQELAILRDHLKDRDNRREEDQERDRIQRQEDREHIDQRFQVLGDDIREIRDDVKAVKK